MIPERRPLYFGRTPFFIFPGLRVKYQNLFDASTQGRDDAFKSATLTRLQQQCNNEAQVFYNALIALLIFQLYFLVH